MILYYGQFKPNDLELNPSIFYVFVESTKRAGGPSDVIYLRNHRQGLPLTLVDNYIENDNFTPLSSETKIRDRTLIEGDLLRIKFVLKREGVVCLPSYQIEKQLSLLNQFSPETENFLRKEIKMITGLYLPHPLDLES